MRKITLLLFSVLCMAVCPNVFAQYGCGSAVALTDGYTANNVTSPGNGGAEDWNNDPDYACTVDPMYWQEDVYLFEYTAGATSETISMTVFTRNAWNGVGIFTDCTGTEFSNCLASAGSDANADVSQTVSATIAAGETAYVAVGQWGPPAGLDFDVTDFTVTAVNNVPTCDAMMMMPADGADDVTAGNVQLTWSAAAGATSYNVSVGTTSGGTDVVDDQNVGNTTMFDLTGLTENTTYFVNIVPENASGQATNCTEYSFETDGGILTSVDCSAGPVNTTFCYGNNEFVDYVYTSNDGSPLIVTVNAGQVQDGWDEFTVLDSDGSQLYSGYGNAGDLSGLTFQSTGDQITVQVDGDPIASCQDSGYTPIDYDVTCATCINPTATFNVVSDCANGSQFNIEVNLTSIGDATDVDITDGTNVLGDDISTAGVYTYGPFPNGTDVELFVLNNQDSNCEISSGDLTQTECLESFIDCSAGTPVNETFCYENNSTNDIIFVSDDGSGVTITVNAGQVQNGFDPFVVLDSDGTELYNGFGNAGDISGLTFTSSGDQLTVQVDADALGSCQDSGYTPIDIDANCSSCQNPQATYTVVEDCINGPQFNIEVDLTNLGSASTVDITDNQGNSEDNVATTGVYTFGPYANGTLVDFTIENNDDPFCTITSEELTQDQCAITYIDCASGTPVNTTFCYENGTVIEYVYQSTDGSPINLTVNSGQVQQGLDEFKVFDTDGSQIYNGYGANGDLTGLTFQSTGDQLTVEVTPSFSVSCASEGYDPIDLTLTCSSCLNPDADFEVIEDCINGDQFIIEVDLTSIGDATDVDITDNQGNSIQDVNTPGVYNLGPYANGTLVEVDVTNNQDNSCVVSSAELTQDVCTINYVDCSAGPTEVTFCYENNQITEFVFTNIDNETMYLNVLDGAVDAGFDEFIVLDSAGNQIYNGYGNNGDLSTLNFESTGNEITVQVDAGPNVSCASGDVEPITVSVACTTCDNPQATYTVVENCIDGPEFFVDVEITDLGSATDLEITDNQSSTPQTASSLGVYTFGPYTNGTPVEFIVSNNQDPNCNIYSPELTQEECFDLYIACSQGEPPLNFDICYGDSNLTEYVIQSDDGTNLNVNINSGTVQDGFDEFIVLDTDGSEIYNGYGNGGNLTGFNFQSTGGTVTIQVDASASNSCDGGGQTPINVTISCATCVNPDVSYNLIQDCVSNSDEFFVDVVVNDLGSGSSVEISDDLGSTPQTASTVGTYQFGPYTTGQQIPQFFVVNNDDPNCEISSQGIDADPCPTGPLSVDTTTFTVPELVNDVLIGNDCSQVFNITWSTGTNFGQENGIAYFNKNSSNFPMEDGVVMVSGDVNQTPGPAGNQSSGGGWPGDPDINQVIIDGGGTGTSNDATIIEFDFIPFLNEVSFNFLFASEEYGTFQCSFSDSFLFYVTDSNGVTENIAVVPGTTTPISVTTIRDNAFNGGCPSANEQYFANFFDDLNPNAQPENTSASAFDGITVPMTAVATVIPGEQYHMKLAIGDRGDTILNSAVFLEAGSLDIGELPLPDDITIDSGNANCEGDAIVLDTGLVPDPNVNIVINWYKDQQIILDANGDPVDTPTLTVTETGDYFVSVIYNNTCPVTGEVYIEFFTDPEVDLGDDVQSICPGSDLTLDATPTNIADIVDPDTNLTYEWSLDGNVIAGETDATLTVNTPGVYEVLVTNGSCETIETVTIQETDFEVNFDNASVACTQQGSTNSYELVPDIIGVPAGDLGDLTYEWSMDGNVIAGETDPTLVVTQEGQYSVTVTYLGCEETASYDVEFTEAPIVDLGMDQIVCEGETVTLDATPSNGADFTNLSYSWIDDDGMEVATTATATLGAGTYTVIVSGEFTNSGQTFTCDGTDTIVIDEISYTLDLGGDQELCDQASYTITANIVGEPSTNATYQWSDANGVIAGETGSTLTVSDDGIYTVDVDINGCAEQAMVDILFIDTPQIDLGADITECSLQGVILDATPSNIAVADVMYTWELDGQTIPENGPTVDTEIYGYGTYTVTASPMEDLNDVCSDTTDSITITQITGNLVVAITSGDPSASVEYCDLTEELPVQEITFTATLTGGSIDQSQVTYTWFVNGNEISGATDATYTAVYDTAGDFTDTYTVEATFGACTFTSNNSEDVNVSITELECDVIIPEGISPSRVDGMNDCLDLSALNQRSGIASLKLYNRHGRLIFEKSDYVDTFCGQDMNGNELATGTYFYILEMVNEDPDFGRVKKGWIYVNQSNN